MKIPNISTHNLDLLKMSQKGQDSLPTSLFQMLNFGGVLYLSSFQQNATGGFTWVFPKIGIPQSGWFIMEIPYRNG